MKIHRIETVNLNSLYGSQSLDLDEALGGASLFLIYGPTGSGKSTLMDAVSLALFGVTPRLDATRGVQSADPRAVMSRAMAECSAKIVFSKIEEGGRRTYRATWSARRARKKAAGALQAAVRTMERRAPDGSWQILVSSHKGKELQPVFEEVLEGFGVRDFNRTMLLAQGQFDAFLGAPADQRAAILERLTDTSIYQELGQRAAALRARYKRRLDALRTLAAAGGGLDDSARLELTKDHAAHQLELDRQNDAHRQARCRLEWLDAAVQLRETLDEAKATQATLVGERREVAGALAELAQHERGEGHKAFARLDADALARRRVAEGEEQLVALAESVPRLLESIQARTREAAAAASRQRAAAAHLEALRPLVAAAEQAASKHARAVDDAAATTTRRAALDVRVAEHAGKVARAAGAAEEAEAEAEAAEARVAAHAADGQLADAWDPLRTRLDQLVSTAKVLARGAAALDKRDADFARDEAKLGADETEHEAGRASVLEPLRGALSTARSVLALLLTHADFEASRSEAADAVARARSERDAIKDAAEPVTSARRAAAKLADEVHPGVASVEAELAEARATLEGLATQAGHRDELETQADQAYERTKRVAGLVGHRARLVDGEPCELCGSEQHPWAHDAERAAADAAIHETLAAGKAALDEASRALAEATRLHREAKHVEVSLGTQLEVLQRQRRAAAEQQVALDEAAAVALTALGLPVDSSPDELHAALQAATRRLLELDDALAALDDAQRKVGVAEAKLRQATELQQLAEAQLIGRKAKLEERGQQLAEEHRAHDAATEAATEERDACTALLADLGVTPEGDDPTAWRDLGDRRRDAQRDRLKAAANARADASEKATVRVGEQKLLRELETHRDELVDEQRQQELVRDDARAQAETARAGLDESWGAASVVGGARPPEPGEPKAASSAQLLEAQEAWVAASREAAQQAESAERDARAEHGAAEAQHQTLARGQAQREARRDEAEAQLAAVLAALDLPTLEAAGREALQALRLDDARVAELRGTKKAFDDRAVRVATLIVERTKRVEAHAVVRPDGLADDALADEARRAPLVEALTVSERLLDAAIAAHQRTGDELRDHQRAEKEQEEHRRLLLEAEGAARVWETLHQYIGVNDGGKFKRFAQALNLGQLLDKANVHLERLSERYRLVPRLDDGLPTLDFDLSDLWQLGQRVAPRSLSGGERFLVSLSLALGLSDFRSVAMPIETLLLDEGFGTLDPDTLSVALGALSQLQVDGRQIGIISHVMGLRESIEARIEVKPLGGGRSEVKLAD